KAAWAMPTAWAAIPIRPPSSVPIAILKPWPSWPRMLREGTRQSSKCIRSEGRLGDAHRLGRYPDPPAVERAHRDLEALALLAEDVARGHPAVLEVHPIGRPLGRCPPPGPLSRSARRRACPSRS